MEETNKEELRQALAAAHALCEKLRHLLEKQAGGCTHVGTRVCTGGYETKPLRGEMEIKKSQAVPGFFP